MLPLPEQRGAAALDIVWTNRDVFIPLIDTPKARRSFFKKGQFAVSFDPSIHPVAVSFSDRNHFDFELFQSALRVLKHDLDHGAEVSLAYNANSLASTEMNREQILETHGRLLNMIHSSPRPNRLLRYYDDDLHERPRFMARMFLVYNSPRWVLRMVGPGLCFSQPLGDYFEILPVFLRGPDMTLMKEALAQNEPRFLQTLAEYEGIRQKVNQALAANPGARVCYAFENQRVSVAETP